MAAPPSKWPQMVDRLVLYWPVGGAKYRIQGQARFNEHAAYVQQHGLAGVVKLAGESDKSFGADPRRGPWVSVLRRDRAKKTGTAELGPSPRNVDVNSRGERGMRRTILIARRDRSPASGPRS